MPVLNGKNLFRTGCLLGSTALPGAQRILLFFAVEHFFGLSALGRFANDMSVVFMVGFFTAVGWSSMIMIRVPQSEGVERFKTLFSIARLSLVILIPAVLVIFILGYWGFVFSPIWACFVLCSWSFFMLFRRFLLAVKGYIVLVLSETVLLISIPIILWVFKSDETIAPFLCYSIPCAFISILGSIYALIKLKRDGCGVFNKQPAAFRRGIEFGLNNFVGGGRTYLLTPLAVHLAGEAYGGLLGLISSILGIVLLFPRTLSQYHLPDISKMVKAGDNVSFCRHLAIYRRQVVIMLTVIFVLVSIGWFIFSLTPYYAKFDLDGGNVIFFIMLAAITIDQAVIVEGNSLMVREMSSTMLKINIYSSFFLIIMLAIPVAFSFSPLISMYLILVFYLISNLLRSTFLFKRAHGLNCSLSTCI